MSKTPQLHRHHLLVTGVPATGTTELGEYLRECYDFVHLDVEDVPTPLRFWQPSGLVERRAATGPDASARVLALERHRRLRARASTGMQAVACGYVPTSRAAITASGLERRQDPPERRLCRDRARRS